MSRAIELTGVRKQHTGLRPLRLRELTVSEREIVALDGLDAAAAEVLTNLVTGATVPDEGSVRVFGEDTAAIGNADAWLAGLDRFGIVSDRVALLDTFTVRQNIAIPLTLDLDPLTDEVAGRVLALAAEVGLEADLLGVAAGLSSPSARLRARMARAIAPSPQLLLVEHPTGPIPRADVSRLATDFFRFVRARGLTALIASSDRDFTAAADRHLVLDPATGALKRRGFRAWFP
jgi:predicted ABC-type transport system involved in lysophospholipase L1 biosynthesis ATPase subunit